MIVIDLIISILFGLIGWSIRIGFKNGRTSSRNKQEIKDLKEFIYLELNSKNEKR